MSILTPRINKIETGAVPVGSIVAYNPGYYTNTGNAGFTFQLVSGNTIADVNAYLPSDWKVCDGSELIDADSPIWNAAGRHLPNLTDDRFIKGSTSAGSIGGTDSITPSGTNSGGAASFNKTVMNTNQNSHEHLLDSGGSNTLVVQGVASGGVNKTVNSTSAPSANYRPDTDARTISWTSSTVSTSFTNPTFTGTPVDTLPTYLSTYYIIKVK